MKKVFATTLILFFILNAAQDLQKIAKEITDGGTALYRSEMASWYGTDVFMENYKQPENISGYFSYLDDGVPKCIFFSKENKVIGTISFPTNYNPKDSKLDLTERDFTLLESDYFDLRLKARKRTKNDTIFKYYKDSNYNFVPLITKNEKKVYILAGTDLNNLVLFGNDYLIHFSKNNEITKVERLHKSLIEQTIVDVKVGKTVSGIHSHVLEDWPFITPTDICTLMLYQKFTNWENYTVVSKKYTSFWNCKSNSLVILKTDAVRKINEDHKKRHPENYKKDDN